MVFQPVQNAYGVEIRMTWDGVDVESTLGFSRIVPASQAQLDTLCSNVEAWFVSELLPQLAGTIIYRETYGRDLETNPFIQGLANAETGDTGSNVSPSLPNQTTKSIIFKSALAGRSARGANRIPGLTESQVTNRVVNSGTLTSLRTAYLALNGYVTANGCKHCIVSRESNGEAREAGVIYLVTDYSFPHARVGTTTSRMT